MTDKPENPPAFAKPQSAGLHGDAQQGITARDFFAAAALGKLGFRTEKEGQPQWIAEKCYEIADAMLRARGDGK